MGGQKDGYSNFGFFCAIAARDLDTDESETGEAIDKRGYETAIFIVDVNSLGSDFSSASTLDLTMQFFNSTASAWSGVPASQILHSVFGEGGAYSTNATGRFAFLSTDGFSNITDVSAAVIAVGYRGQERTLRINASGAKSPSVLIGAVAILGVPSIWPVNDPVGVDGS